MKIFTFHEFVSMRTEPSTNTTINQVVAVLKEKGWAVQYKYGDMKIFGEKEGRTLELEVFDVSQMLRVRIDNHTIPTQFASVHELSVWLDKQLNEPPEPVQGSVDSGGDDSMSPESGLEPSL